MLGHEKVAVVPVVVKDDDEQRNSNVFDKAEDKAEVPLVMSSLDKAIQK